MNRRVWNWAKRQVLLSLATIAATLLVVSITLNLSSGETTIAQQIPHLYYVEDPQFVRSMGTLLGPALVGGNTVEPLVNGDQIFPSMLDAIRNAEKTITFETYIYWSGNVGKKFADALAERASAGIKVHVLMDWIGAGKADDSLIDTMKTAGVEVEKYRPLKWYNINRWNNRTHRKLLVVDGRVGFTGGVGIADLWSGNAQDPKHWRDSHFRIEGPAVAQMQAAFMDNWMKTRSLVLHGEDYFPQLEPKGGQLAQVFKSSAGEGSESLRLMYLMSIAAAKERILLANAYFVPDDLSVQALVSARRRGVKVEIIVPGEHTDSDVVRQASRSRWGTLLDAGVAIYEYQPTMMHAKIMIVDGLWTSVGSTNFDNRSFRLNDEANLNVLDAGFAQLNETTFEADKSRSRRVTRQVWEARSWIEKFSEWTAGLLGPQL